MKTTEWLLIFYSVPAKPVNNRMRLWRKLAIAGAVPLKGAVYILPYSDEHYELFQWLISEVTEMRGEGSFVKVATVETMSNEEIGCLFNNHREQEYGNLGKTVDQLERKLGSIRMGGKAQSGKVLFEQYVKHKKEYEAIRARDFFSSEAGPLIANRLKTVEREIRKLTEHGEEGAAAASAITINPKRKEEYQGRTWVTRKHPFVDRMASAWLVKRFIDSRAVFEFIDETELGKRTGQAVTFDIRGGDFTHVGDLCTFEVLVRAFGIKDKAVRKIAELVHDLDVKDGKYDVAEARGIDEVLGGIRTTATDDQRALEQGMAVFGMLYASKKHSTYA